jgi:hypothetical protein
VGRLPSVVSPIQPLFRRGGIEIALISVELWPDRLVVRLAGLPGKMTYGQGLQYEAELEQWGARLASAREAAGDLPEQPGTRLLSTLQIMVEDEAGTTYVLRSFNTGGTGSEWHGDWFFSGNVPDTVNRLTVQVSAPEGEAATVVLDLADTGHGPNSDSSGR